MLGLTLGILNYARDRGALKVDLLLGIVVTGDPRYPPGVPYAAVTVANCGRRPIWFSSVALILNTGEQGFITYAQPTRLEEGSEPAHVIFDRSAVEHGGRRILCARVTDGVGRKHYSKMS